MKKYIIIESRLSDEYQPEITSDYYDDSINNDDVYNYIRNKESDESIKKCKKCESESIDEEIINNKIDNAIELIHKHLKEKYEITVLDTSDDICEIMVHHYNTNEYVGTWDFDLDDFDNENVLSGIAAEIEAVNIFDESIIESIGESNNKQIKLFEDPETDFNELLKSFNVFDIKSTFIDKSAGVKSYIGNILKNDNSENILNEFVNKYDFKSIENNEYTLETNYGDIQINDGDDEFYVITMNEFYTND